MEATQKQKNELRKACGQCVSHSSWKGNIIGVWDKYSEDVTRIYKKLGMHPPSLGCKGTSEQVRVIQDAAGYFTQNPFDLIAPEEVKTLTFFFKDVQTKSCRTLW
jgi:hypothetical protein